MERVNQPKINRSDVERTRQQSKSRNLFFRVIDFFETLTALKEQKEKGVYIDLATIVAWENWIKEERQEEN